MFFLSDIVCTIFFEYKNETLFGTKVGVKKVAWYDNDAAGARILVVSIATPMLIYQGVVCCT